jgi:hypothetical protein
MTKPHTIGRGKSFADLGNAVSDAINAALRRGMGVDEATSVVVQVAADYGRGAYDNLFLQQLARIVIDRGDVPMPGEVSDG